MNQSDSATASTRADLSKPDWMAFSWGLLEAVTLFIVPDTWISRQALISWRAGVIAAAWSLIGAMLGGIALYLAAARYQAEILAFYDWLPGIGPALTAKAASQLQANGVVALFLGGYTGTPFKLFAAQANAAGIDIVTFAAVAVISRGSRFLFTTAVCTGLGLAARRAGLRLRALLWVHAAVWALFYAWYWTVMAE